jgi:Tfp pilus assembly protein PilX
MDDGGARKFRVAPRVWFSIIAVCVLLLASVLGNLELYRRAEAQRSRAIAAERAEAARAEERRLQAAASEKEEAERARTLAKQRAAKAEDAARVRQLYEELNSLSQMSDRILMENQRLQLPVKKGERSDQTRKDPSIRRTGN